MAPELEPLVGPAPETLTSIASSAERTRWYSRYRTRRIAHGIVDFLKEWAEDTPLTLALNSVDQADPTDLEFLSIALRRLEPARIRLIVCSSAEVPELDGELAAYAQRQIAPDQRDCKRAEAVDLDQATAAFVTSDGTSDVPGEYEAYLQADPQLRSRLHDDRAAEIAALGSGRWRLARFHITWSTAVHQGPKARKPTRRPWITASAWPSIMQASSWPTDSRCLSTLMPT